MRRTTWIAVALLACFGGCGEAADDGTGSEEPRLDPATAGSWTILAGDPGGKEGFADGAGAAARFRKPIRLAGIPGGGVVVADIFNHAIRVVDLDGRVRTLAGSPDRKGHRDGPAAEACFASPHGVAVAPDGRIAVAEAENHTIRLLIPEGDPDSADEIDYRVSTLAGVAGQSGFQDGPAASALFASPHALQWIPDGSLVVADIGNARLRLIRDGVVTTLAGSGETGSADGAATTASFHYPMDLALTPQGGVLVADAGSHTIRYWMPDGEVGTLKIESAIETPHGVAAAPGDVVVVAEMGRHRVVAIDSSGALRVLCGRGEPGLDVGSLNRPAAVLLHAGRLWVADLDNHRIQVAPWPLP